MSKLHTWVHEKDPVVALMAIQFIVLSESFSRMLSAATKPSTLVPLGQLERIPLDDWLSFYTNRRLYLQPLLDTLKFKSGFENALLDEAEARKTLGRLLDSPLTVDTASDIFTQSASSVDDPFESFDQNDSQLLRSLVFLILVAVPCWFLYLKQPGQLFREARRGNLTSLEMLLRLDSSALFDPTIAKRLHDLRFTFPAKFERLIGCVAKPPKRIITRKKFKASLAGGISAMAHYNKAPLTEPEIRALFDAVTSTLSQDKVEIDSDLPESPEAFAKAIRREAPAWRTIIRPDKK